MKAQYFANNNNQTIYIMNDDKLIETKLVKMLYTVDENGMINSQLVVTDNKGVKFVVDGKQFGHVYYSKEDFENGRYAYQHMNDTRYDMNEDVYFENLDNRKISCQNLCLKYWHMVNGEPKQEVVKVDKFEYRYTEHDGELCIADSLIPKDAYYANRNECLSYNDWIDVDKNGKQTKHVGVNKLIKLDDDQKKLVEKFKDVIAELEKNGVAVVGDTCEGMQFFNTRKIENWAIDWDDTLENTNIPEDDRQNYKLADRYGACEIAESLFPQWGDDADLYVKPKEDVNE